MSAPATMSLGALRAAHVRLWTPWTGVWLADVDVDLDKTKAVPAGAQTLTIGTAKLVGTVDDSRAGRFGEKASLRLLGGGGGWHKPVPARSFHNDAGLTSRDVIEATAAEVGEIATDLAPVPLAVDFERAGEPATSPAPASAVLANRPWWVGFDGKTVVGARPVATAPKSAEVLSWSGLEQRAELACDELLVPGTTIADARYGTIVLRDIEQTFADGSARAVAWCGPVGVSRLVDSLVTLVRQRLGGLYLGRYAYRVVRQNVDGRLELQAVERERGLPDMLPVTAWPGVPGVTAKVANGTIVHVEFIAGDPSRPVVTGFEGTKAPQSVTLTAGAVNIGGDAAKALAIAELVDARLSALAQVFQAWNPAGTLADGTALKALLLTLMAPPTSWPASVAAEKAKGV